MARPRNAVPRYEFHKPTGQAYVRLPDGLGGRITVYLGPFNSPESKQEYARLTLKHANGRGSAPLAMRLIRGRGVTS